MKNIEEAKVGSGTAVANKDAEKRAQLTLKSIKLRIKQQKEREALASQKNAVKTEETVMESFSASQIAALKAEYSKINTVDPSSDTYKKLIAMLDRLDLKSLQSLAGAEIKFVSKLAQNRVMRKSMKKEEVQIDENEDLANARKMYHKHFVAAMKAMPSSIVQKRHQDEMEKYKKIMGNSFIDQVAPSKFAKFDKKIKEEVESIDELSNEKLADYKKKAGENASTADKAGDTKTGNKRFSGIMKATRKQFDNDAKKTNEDVTEASQRVDSLVTDALKIMKGSDLKDAVQALKTVLGDREYNDRRGHYNFYVKQLVDMYGKKANEELDIELDEVLSKDSSAGDFIHDFVNSDNPKFAGKSKEKRKQMALAAYYAKQKNEELSPKQKEIDKNKNGKIDGFDLAHLRKKTEELSPAQKAIDKNKNGKIDGADLAHLRSKKKQPQGADFAAQRRKERLASNGRMDEESINEKSDYETYHKDYSSAVQTAIKQAEKRGFEVDMDDWHDKVATGPKKPSAGKTNSFSVKLKKDGKESKKALHLQVYNMDNHKYELNMYIESVEEAASPAQQAAIAIAMKKAGKKPKDMEESDAYDKNVKPSDKPHDKDAAAKRAKLAALAARKKMTEGLMDKIKAMKRGAEAKAKADDHFDKAGDPKNANASKDLKKAVRYTNLLNKEGTGPDLNPVAKHVTKGELKKSGISKWLAVSEEEKVPEFKSGGPELAKKFNKAFKAFGVDSKVKIKTVGNVSVNEEEIVEAKKPKKLKDVMKNKKIKEETPSKKTVEKGDQLTGKKEPIEINPELKENKE